MGYGKLDNKTGAKLEEMSIEERKSYCLHDAHMVAELVRINNGDILKIMQSNSLPHRIKIRRSMSQRNDRYMEKDYLINQYLRK